MEQQINQCFATSFPLNKKWLKDHPQFLEKRVHEIRNIISNMINSRK